MAVQLFHIIIQDDTQAYLCLLPANHPLVKIYHGIPADRETAEGIYFWDDLFIFIHGASYLAACIYHNSITTESINPERATQERREPLPHLYCKHIETDFEAYKYNINTYINGFWRWSATEFDLKELYANLLK